MPIVSNCTNILVYNRIMVLQSLTVPKYILVYNRINRIRTLVYNRIMVLQSLTVPKY
jgi:hypothetical protein